MKKLLLTALGFASGLGVFAQLPVNTTPENKNAILEEYTGIYCQYCPDGHRIANEMKAANPNDVFVVNVHVGGYASPGPGDPDFRTSFGTALANQSGLSGYPAGSINRHVFSGGVTAMSRGSWSSRANTTMGQASYVNIACEATIDVSTRLITVDVEAYFTGAGAPGSMNINVAITQDNVEGPQTAGSTYNPDQVLPNGNYLHSSMLRHFITGQWGDVITTTSPLTLIQKQYTWTVPATINGVPVVLEDLNILSYIAEGQQEIITADDGPITYTGLANANDAKLVNVDSYKIVCGSTITPEIEIQNRGGATMTNATITYDVNGGTPMIFPWGGSISTYDTETITLNAINFVNQGNNNINVTITDVNGSPDGNTSDNSGSRLGVIMAPNTQGTTYELTLNQDRWGNEITWEFIDDATGLPVPGGTGGPYSILGSNGTQANIHNITLPNTGCYTFWIYDSEGDGINSGSGAGYVILRNSAGGNIFFFNGQFDFDERKPFNVTSLFPVGIEEALGENNLKIYPNPTISTSTISFNLTESASVSMEVYNTMGSLVSSIGTKTMNAGSQELLFDGTNLSNGIYIVNLMVGDDLITKKISLLK
jgi:hypothetical protein